MLLFVLLSSQVLGATEAPPKDDLPVPLEAAAEFGEGEGAVGVFGATAELGLQMWRRAVSPGDGDRCSFRPTCSTYAVEAVKLHGIDGIILALDRLQRDAGADEFPLTPDGAHHLDPVAAHLAPVDGLLGRSCRRQRRAGAVACF